MLVSRFCLVGACALLLAGGACVSGLSNGLGLTPPMGWNSWNHFGCDVSETLIRKTADAMVETGLAAAGYNHVNIDDCWQVARENLTGRIIPDPVNFASGIPALVTYVNQRGLKLGLYSDAGLATCQGRPGGLFFETVDAQTYAEWGISYLKYDNCNSLFLKPELRYPPMVTALNATGHALFFSMCEWGVDQPYEWAPYLANSWRTTLDIMDTYESMVSNILYNDAGWRVAGPGQWNDPDMLEIGNGGLNQDEAQTHMSLWSLAKAPLIIGCDVTNMTSATLALLTNAEVIAVNQDPLAVQGHRIWNDTVSDVWAGPLSGDRFVAVLWNREGSGALSIALDFDLIGASPSAAYSVRDLWQATDLGDFTGQLTIDGIQPHASTMLVLTPVSTKDQATRSKPTRRHAKIVLDE